MTPSSPSIPNLLAEDSVNTDKDDASLFSEYDETEFTSVDDLLAQRVADRTLRV